MIYHPDGQKGVQTDAFAELTLLETSQVVVADGTGSFRFTDVDLAFGSNSFTVETLRDDLKCIKGIGPAIEKTLNELGIFLLSQIAEMTEYDIDRVASRLKGFRSRIYREDWIGQARDLQSRSPESYV